jgi:hypothetical protein
VLVDVLVSVVVCVLVDVLVSVDVSVDVDVLVSVLVSVLVEVDVNVVDGVVVIVVNAHSSEVTDMFRTNKGLYPVATVIAATPSTPLIASCSANG